MQQIDSADGLFHDGNPTTGELGTIVSAAWLNMAQSELANLVTGLGGTLDTGKHDQLKTLLSATLDSKAAKATTLAGYGIGDAAPKHNAALTGTPTAPTAPAGTATTQLATTGFVTDALANNAGLPLLFPLWCPNRAAIPAGYAPADGQTLARSLYPDAWAGIAAGNVPTVADASWLSTPTERGKFTAGDGSSTFRLPDYNGRAAGSLGAVFMRGDGALSAGMDGVIQQDAFQGHWHRSYDGNNGTGVRSTAAAAAPMLPAPDSLTIVRDAISDGVNGAPRIASETRPLNVTGCWVIRLFGAVTNPGAADAAQLATEMTKLKPANASLTGTLLPYAGIDQPAWGLPLLGGAVSRTAYPRLFAVLCPLVTGTTTAGSAAVTVPSTLHWYAGMPVEGAAFAAGTTVTSIDSTTTATLSKTAGTSGSGSLQVFLYGYGAGGSASTFGLPLGAGDYLRAYDGGRGREQWTMTGNLAASSNVVTGLASTRGILIGATVTHASITGGSATVTKITANSITISATATGTVTSAALYVAGMAIGAEGGDAIQQATGALTIGGGTGVVITGAGGAATGVFSAGASRSYALSGQPIASNDLNFDLSSVARTGPETTVKRMTVGMYICHGEAI